MRTIWKYPVFVGESVKHSMPRFSPVVHFAAQGDGLQIWALVDPSEPKEECEFIVLGTGWDIADDNLGYLRTCQVGPYVWHLFDKRQQLGKKGDDHAS